MVKRKKTNLQSRNKELIKTKSEINELGNRKETLINQRLGFFRENNKAINKSISHGLLKEKGHNCTKLEIQKGK